MAFTRCGRAARLGFGALALLALGAAVLPTTPASARVLYDLGLPTYLAPPPYYGYGAAVVGAGIAFGVGYAIGRSNWGWSYPNWRGGSINVNVNNNYYSNRTNYRNYNQNGNWQHNVEHRKGVAYRDTSVQNRYQRPATGAGSWVLL